MNNLKDLINIITVLSEERDENIEYDQKTGQVIAKLKSHKSASYTKLAQKIETISRLEEEIKNLKSEVKQQTREDIAGLFDASDIIHTRVVETISYIFTLSKNPEPSETPQYKKILEELSKHLTPELIVMLEGLKKSMVTVTEREPSLRITKVSENISDNQLEDFSHRFKNITADWSKDYSRKLNKLKQFGS